MSCSRKLLFLFLLYMNPTTASELYTADKQEVKKKPNVVVIIVDDLGIGDLGCYGNKTLRTPNIDSIANQGVQFQHNLSPETVCTPSRAAMLTGR